jgi:regulator of protease activity HflC (stomatin/prohibitin superfamily)
VILGIRKKWRHVRKYAGLSAYLYVQMNRAAHLLGMKHSELSWTLEDNAPINVDFLIYWRISDPLKSVVNVVNFPGALQGVATTTLRAVIGDILLDEVLSKREQINEVLRVKLDEVTERWGGKVTTVEIREITPPRDVQDAMIASIRR